MNSWLDFVINQCHKDKNKTAFIVDEDHISYESFLKLCYRYYLYLKNQNIKEGDNVFIITKRHYKYFALYGGCVIGKFVFVPLEEKINEARIDFYRNKLTNTHLIENFMDVELPECDLEIEEIINSLDIDKETIAQIMFTSGSQSEPKGVASNNAFLTNIVGKREGYNENTAIVVPVPLNHYAGFHFTLCGLKAGGTVIYIKNAFDFDGFFTAFEKGYANTFFMTPSILKAYLNTGEEEFSKLPIVHGSVSGEYCPKALKDRYFELFHHRLVSYYGSSEGGFIAVDMYGDEEGCVGEIAPDKKISIINDEIAIDEGYMFSYYVGQEKMVPPFMTGDLGYVKDNKIYFKGRNDSIINSGGLKINPLEVMNAALSNLKVKDALCLGKDDPIFQKIPVLFYVGDIDEDELKNYLSNVLEQYKVPNDIRKIDEFKKTMNGKTDAKYYQKLLND